MAKEAKETKETKEVKDKNVITLKTLTKSTVWDIQENDIFRIMEKGDKEIDLKDNLRRFADIIRSAFMIEEIKDDKIIREKYTKQGYKVGSFKLGDDMKVTWAIKKRPIMRVTDLTYENVRHITAVKLMEVLERNFGGGWESLSQSIQDIIESGFDISTTTLPKDRLHKKGGMYEKKVADGYEVLEIEKGLWVEAIFAKLKPEAIKPQMKYNDSKLSDDDDDEDDDDLLEDDYNKVDEDDDMEVDEPNDDEINENNYRTTFAIENDQDEDAESLSDYIVDE